MSDTKTPTQRLEGYYCNNLPPDYRIRNCWEDEWYVYRGEEMIGPITRGFPSEKEAREAAWWHHRLG